MTRYNLRKHFTGQRDLPLGSPKGILTCQAHFKSHSTLVGCERVCPLYIVLHVLSLRHRIRRILQFLTLQRRRFIDLSVSTRLSKLSATRQSHAKIEGLTLFLPGQLHFMPSLFTLNSHRFFAVESEHPGLELHIRSHCNELQKLSHGEAQKPGCRRYCTGFKYT